MRLIHAKVPIKKSYSPLYLEVIAKKRIVLNHFSIKNFFIDTVIIEEEQHRSTVKHQARITLTEIKNKISIHSSNCRVLPFVEII